MSTTATVTCTNSDKDSSKDIDNKSSQELVKQARYVEGKYLTETQHILAIEKTFQASNSKQAIVSICTDYDNMDLTLDLPTYLTITSIQKTKDLIAGIDIKSMKELKALFLERKKVLS